MKKTYITTPLYYVNDKPHIGHGYTTILADVLTRYNKMLNREVFFLTGTDEHGQKVQEAADKSGVTPQQHVEKYHQNFVALWEKLNINYDKFIRTTDKNHVQKVQNMLNTLSDKTIYLGDRINSNSFSNIIIGSVKSCKVSLPATDCVFNK